MNDPDEANRYKIILMLVILTVVWGICFQAEQKFNQRFQEELISRMGKRKINSTRMQLVQKLHSKFINEDELQKIQSQLDSMLIETYHLDIRSEQQPICVIFRDFDSTQSQADYSTINSILSQNYSNFNIIHIRSKNSSPAPMIKIYLLNRNISLERYVSVIVKHDTIEALFNASVKCLESSIMVLIESREKFISSLVLKVINSNFKRDTDLVWATSLYGNGRLGFSFDYSDQIKKNNNYRKYPLAMNDVIAYKNSLLSKCRTAFSQFHLKYPLNVAESFAWTFLEHSKQTKYISEILSFKPQNGTYRFEKSQFDRQLQQLIRQNKSVGSFLEKSLLVK